MKYTPHSEPLLKRWEVKMDENENVDTYIDRYVETL